MTIASALLSGCRSLVVFTHEMRAQHNLSDEDLRELQFYVSHDVTLRRELHTKRRIIDDGHLKLHAGKAIEEVLVEAHTPGVATAVDADTIVISFEEGSSLDFSLRSAASIPLVVEPPSRAGFATAPDPFPAHESIAHDGTGSYWLMADDHTSVSYQGRIWEVVGETFRAHLMIDAESLEEVVESQTTLRGRRLSQTGKLYRF